MGSIQEALLYDIKYLVFACVLISLYQVFDRKNTKRIRIIDMCMITIMVAFSGLRDCMGSDYQEYLRRYNHVILYWSQIVRRLRYEKVYYYLCHLYSKLTEDPFGIFWLSALLMYPALVIVARKVTGRPSRVIGCFMFLELFAMSHNIMRQAIAVELVMFGYIALKYHKRILGAALFTLSIGFHLSALAGIAVLLLYPRVIPTKQNIIKFNIIGLITAFTWRPLLLIIKRISIFGKYTHYIEQTGHPIVRYGMVAYIFFYSLLAFWMIKYSDKISRKSIFYHDAISQIILSIPFFYVATQIAYVYRIALYIFPISIFSIGDMLNAYANDYYLNINVRLKLTFSMIAWLALANIIALDNTFWQFAIR